MYKPTIDPAQILTLFAGSAGTTKEQAFQNCMTYFSTNKGYVSWSLQNKNNEYVCELYKLSSEALSSPGTYDSSLTYEWFYTLNSVRGEGCQIAPATIATDRFNFTCVWSGWVVNL